MPQHRGPTFARPAFSVHPGEFVRRAPRPRQVAHADDIALVEDEWGWVGVSGWAVLSGRGEDDSGAVTPPGEDVIAKFGVRVTGNCRSGELAAVVGLVVDAVRRVGDEDVGGEPVGDLAAVPVEQRHRLVFVVRLHAAPPSTACTASIGTRMSRPPTDTMRASGSFMSIRAMVPTAVPRS